MALKVTRFVYLRREAQSWQLLKFKEIDPSSRFIL